MSVWNNQLTFVSFKGESIVAVSSPRGDARGVKQRKVSPVSDSDQTGTGPPEKIKPTEPGMKGEDHVPRDPGQKCLFFLSMWLFEIVNITLSRHSPFIFFFQKRHQKCPERVKSLVTKGSSRKTKQFWSLSLLVSFFLFTT